MYVVERVSCTYVVQVNVDSTKVVQNKVSDGISALNGVRVAVEGLEEPWVSEQVSITPYRIGNLQHTQQR
jgi:hypothetical protein